MWQYSSNTYHNSLELNKKVGLYSTFLSPSQQVEFSPFDGEQVAVATAQYFGLVGNGRLHLVHRSAVSGELREVKDFKNV